jgi:hypothetical protein
VIAVFTKFDQFSRDIGMKLEDQGRNPDDLSLVNAEMERIFNDEFLINLKGSPPVIRLESKDFHQPAFISPIAVTSYHRNAQAQSTVSASYRNDCKCAL